MAEDFSVILPRFRAFARYLLEALPGPYNLWPWLRRLAVCIFPLLFESKRTRFRASARYLLEALPGPYNLWPWLRHLAV